VADAHFEDAVLQARAAGAAPWLADAQVEPANALLRRGGAANRGRAEALLAEAVVTCDGLGLQALGVRARALLS
jgi:hypothetical protein